MMDWTDRHCRVFHRLLSRRARLYTEMVTAEAILHGKRDKLLAFDPVEHPLALQLGGSDPAKLAAAAVIGESYGYGEINLNVGCPSDRVQGGNFGACLMAEPNLVAACIAVMKAAVKVPVTVKCRIGIDDQDSEADFEQFVLTVADAGCEVFAVHARKAWLQGLSPKENREIPPLDYARVYRLKAAHPELTVVINGGISTLEEASGHLNYVDGVMLGRAAYQTPWLLAQVDRIFFGHEGEVRSRAGVLSELVPYVARHIESGGRLHNVVRHVLGVYHGESGGRAFRRHLSERGVGRAAGIHVLQEAIAIAEEGRHRRDRLAQERRDVMSEGSAL
jgi:tRNA-dihydrouridine synthase A